MVGLKVYAIIGAVLIASAWAVSSDNTAGYEKEMAALETDEWTPKHGKEAVATELIQEKAAPSASETAFDENAGENGPTSLFPGPTYGLPGYKESHDWLNDLDWWSPLVFEWRYYKARCAEGCTEEDGTVGTALKDMSEGQVKKYWFDTGMDLNDVASSTFNCNFYVEQNEDLHEELLDENKKVRCKKAVKHFLTQGVFDGLSGTSFDGKVFTDGPDDKVFWKAKSQYCPGKGPSNCGTPGMITWDQNYAWTFWYMRLYENDGYDRKVLPVFAVRRPEAPAGDWSGGWWGGYPFFVTWVGSMMFCATTSKWECHWPIGEENSGIKGGWRFNWYHRWRLPPKNIWRFFGLMVDEDGYTLYEFSDPPIIGNDNLNNGKAMGNMPWAVHGFSRRVATRSKGSWWGYDIHAPYARADGAWSATSSGGVEQIPETCTKTDCAIRCSQQGWHSDLACRLDMTSIGAKIEQCGWCRDDADGNPKRDSGSGCYKCMCVKDWDNLKKLDVKQFSENDARVWTGYTYASWMGAGAGWKLGAGVKSPQLIMDLTYYRLADHVFIESEMLALYEKGRSIKNPNY